MAEADGREEAGEQTDPMMSGSTEAGDEEKARGIVLQTEEDLRGRDADEVLAVLLQRFQDSGVVPDEDELRAEAERIASIPD